MSGLHVTVCNIIWYDILITKNEPVGTLVKLQIKLFLLVEFTLRGLYLDKLLSLEGKRGWLNPRPQTRDHWIPCGHPGATLAVPKVSRNKRCNSTLTGVQDWHTWDSVAGTGLCTEKSLEMYRTNYLEFVPCWNWISNIFPWSSNTQRKSLSSQIPVPS